MRPSEHRSPQPRRYSWIEPGMQTAIQTPETNHRGQTRQRRHHPNNRVDTAASLLRQCTTLPTLKQLHAHILRSNLHRNNSLASTLLSLYAAFASHHEALLVFSSVPRPSLSLFNRAIRAFSKSQSFCLHSLLLYLQMTRQCIPPDNFTYPFLLNSCASLSDLKQGVEVHSRVLKSGFLAHVPVSNALVDMYGKCGLLDCARMMFSEMPVRDVVSYNALLGAHARLGQHMTLARVVFDCMPERNLISWNAMIVGYVNSGDLGSARAVFESMPERNVISWTTMLVGYTTNGMVDMARVFFDGMPERNLVSWSAMISGYAQNGRPDEALVLFNQMEVARMDPDAVTMTGVISASAQLGNGELAKWIGSYVNNKGIERNMRVLTSLVDMHAKCGNVEEACTLFEEISSPDSFSYSALINALATHGHGLKAIEVFNKMLAKAVEPDYITFIGVLNACSHTGLVDEGLRFWEKMVNHYGIEPGSDHYACIVDMLGRAGRLREAHGLVKCMPTGPHAGALGALLAACRTYDDVDIAECVASELFELEPENTGNYMLLLSIYASREQWDAAARVRMTMNQRCDKKLPGYSWAEH